MLKIEEYVDITNYTTFKVGGQFRYFIEVTDKSELLEAYEFAESKNLPMFIIGGGSNMIFPDGVFERVVVHINICGFEVVRETNEYVDLKVAAGENWDYIVENTVSAELSGIEAMSAIPGTVGATPIQNVGAYGQEIKDTLISVEVFDIKERTFKILTNAECHFSYRDSIFKKEAKGNYIIVSIILRLSKSLPSIPNYPGVKKYFIENQINNPTLLQIREAIIEIRKNKLPDPRKIANVGSFFKNPIVEKVVAKKLKVDYPDITVFPVDDAYTKVPAGWLIEQVGLKGKDFGSISIYKNNALVLVNNGNATFSDVAYTRDHIIKTVFDKFGIRLETEPEFVD